MPKMEIFPGNKPKFTIKRRYGLKLLSIKVTESYDGQPGAVLLSRNPLLVVGGDAFSHSNFDGCISSAEKICAAFTSQ